VFTVGTRFENSSYLLLAAFAAPLTLLAVRCSPALLPLGSLREFSATGIAHRSAIQPQSLRLNWFVVQAVLPLATFTVPLCRSLRWNINRGSAATGYRSPSATSIVAAWPSCSMFLLAIR
jgi:hypothetical protein